MPETHVKSILHKMSSPNTGASLPVARQLRRALETAADVRMGLAIEVRAVRQSLRPVDEVRGLLEESGFLALLEGRPGGGFGLDMSVLGGLVEHQTIGSILSRSEVSRAPTRVDAALLAPLLDECLRRFGAAIEADGGDAWGRGYGFGAMVATARALVLALNEGLYHVFELDLSLMGGAREGRMVFAFPDKVDAVLPEDEEGAEAVPEGESLRAGVMMAQATLDAVLAQVSMPLARLQSLEVGETIPLPPDALKTARLVMGEDNAGLPVTLGQLHGFRAVRLKLGQEQTRSPSPQEAASSPTLRDALGEEPVGAASEMVALPLDSVEVAQDPAIAEPHEGSVSDVEEGLDDLDDLLGEIEAEDAAQEPLPA